MPGPESAAACQDTNIYPQEPRAFRLGFAEDIAGDRYVSLETYRRGGEPVRTPVWFVSRDGRLFIVTRDGTGKVRRLRGNRTVRVAVCSMRGGIRGGWKEGSARILEGADAAGPIGWRNAKYGLAARVAGLLSAGRGRMCALEVEFA